MSEPTRFDVAIVGGGMVGMTLAMALADAGFAVAVVDALPVETRAAAAYDGRSSAIAVGSKRVLETLGPLAGLDRRRLADPRYPRLRRARRASRRLALFLHYDHRDLAGPGDRRPSRSAISSRTARSGARSSMRRARPTLAHLAPATVAGLRRQARRYHARARRRRAIEAALVVAADGRDSPLRLAAGIRLAAWDYPQTGIVCTIDARAAARAAWRTSISCRPARSRCCR